ncbi:MAG: glycosyltransferase family 4 protein [Nitrosomonadales bacterium]|nr:glycosyltransferase family 4 protein [Nitrosomonadales bacterium]
MRVLIASQYFWPENFRINEVASTLLERGVEVEVLTAKPNYPKGEIYDNYRAWGCQQELFETAKVFRVPLIPRGKGSGVQLAANYLSFIFFGIFCAPWMLRGRRYDVIFVHGMSPILQALPALFLGWLKGCPVVLWVQDLWPESLAATGYVRNRFVLKLVKQIVRFIYRNVDLLLVQSEAFMAPVSVLASGTPVKYYPNSVDESFTAPSTVEVPDVAGLGDGFSIMFAGNIGTAQAVEVIVEAATLLKEHADIQFIVLGDGSRRDWMLQEAKACNLANLRLPGRFPVETMPGFMQKASVLLVTLADQEIFAATVPNKVQAYMAAGRPIIACLRGEGARLVTAAKAGLAVPAENGPALAEAVLRLYQMSVTEREEMGRNGRAYFKEHFDHERLINQLTEHLQEVSSKGESIR